MNESKALKEIEEYISKFAKKYIAKQIYNEKLNKNLLYICYLFIFFGYNYSK